MKLFRFVTLLHCSVSVFFFLSVTFSPLAFCLGGWWSYQPSLVIVSFLTYLKCEVPAASWSHPIPFSSLNVYALGRFLHVVILYLWPALGSCMTPLQFVTLLLLLCLFFFILFLRSNVRCQYHQGECCCVWIYLLTGSNFCVCSFIFRILLRWNKKKHILV